MPVTAVLCNRHGFGRRLMGGWGSCVRVEVRHALEDQYLDQRSASCFQAPDPEHECSEGPGLSDVIAAGIVVRSIKKTHTR